MARDGEQPRLQTVEVAKLLDALEREHERVVHRVGRFVAVVEQHEAESVEPLCVLLVHFGKRVAITRADTCRQPRIPHGSMIADGASGSNSFQPLVVVVVLPDGDVVVVVGAGGSVRPQWLAA